jgi:lactate permease
MLEPVLAALPIVLILGLMLGLGWPAARAGAAGLAVALALAWTSFSRPGTAFGDLGPPVATAGALAEALFTAATILWIIFPALCIHQLQTRIGAIETLRGALGRLTPDPRLAAVVVAWFFALFIEGAAGFGTTIALAAPLLVSLGLPPVTALSAALLGHAVGVSFGAVGTPVLPQIAATGLSGQEIARTTGLFHGLLGWVMLLFTVNMIRRALPAEAAPSRPLWGYVAAAAALFLLPMLAIAWWVGPELPTLGGALLGGVALALAAMLGLSRVLVHGGMINALAEAAAAGVGGAWPLAAPFVGVLGTFVTGSATASNILFTDFQQATAQDVGLPVLLIIAAQGFGAAVGNIICPHNIIAGGATVGLSGEVGPVLRQTLAACLLYAALGGALALALAWLLPSG